MGQRRKQKDGEQLDQVRAMLLRANALRAGYEARRAAPADGVLPRRPDSGSLPTSAHVVDVSLEKQRMFCTLRGFLDGPQAESVLRDIHSALAKLQPGFDVITDVSRLGAVTSTALPILRRTATALVEAGMRRMVRVVGSAPGGANSVARAAEGLYEARVATSAAEASRLLDAERADAALKG